MDVLQSNVRARRPQRRFSMAGVCWMLCCVAGAGWLFAAAAAPEQHAGGPRYVTRSIEDVRVGDYVLAKDPDNPGPPRPHKVVGLPNNYTLHVVHVTVAGRDGSNGELQATREHPFFTQNRGWVNAKDLRTGDKLQDAEGSPATVARVHIQDRQTDTYNLTVEGVHTFYVQAGIHAVLVHNADSPGGDVPYPDPQRPNYNNGATHMDHEDARVWGGTSANRPLPAETNMRRGGFDGALYREYQELIAQGMTPDAARAAVQSEIDALRNSPPPRPMDPNVLDRLPTRACP